MGEQPFRWNVARREQLGRLVQGMLRQARPDAEFLATLRSSAARILAMAEGADLAFIGRTPENYFDYLSGAFSGAVGTPAIHLVAFSMRWADPRGVRALEPRKRRALFDYFNAIGVGPAAIATGDRPLALVDFIAAGRTMENLIALLQLQAEEEGADWNAVQRRLRIIGLRNRTKNSPNTWRWQQHQPWLRQIPDAVTRTVSVPAWFIFHLANDQPKLTQSFHIGRWDDPPARGPVRAEQRLALAHAVHLYDTGKTRKERHALAGEIAQTHQVRQAAVRDLINRLRH